MTVISATAETAIAQFDTAFAAVIAACADFCGGARQGRDSEEFCESLARRAEPGPAATRH